MSASARCWPGADEVHVHRARLDLEEVRLGDLEASLSADERDRARRFHHERERHRYVAARGWLRALLGAYTGRDPGAIAFAYGERGKPGLAGRAGEQLRFNVSHSEGTALYAFAHGREVGVDVERVRDDVPFEAMARRFLPATEVRALAAAPAGRRLAVFFECWTRREACLKAIGVGLSDAPPSDTDAARFSLYSVDAGPGFVAALAIAAGPGVAAIGATPPPGRRAAAPAGVVTLSLPVSEAMIVPAELD